MLSPGDVLDLKPLGMKFTIKDTGESPNRGSLEMEIELDPASGGTPVHTHPNAEEAYEVLQGEFDVYINDAWKTFSAGEIAVAKKGIPHTFRNATDKSVRVLNTHDPAMNFAGYFEGLYGLVERGIIDSDKMSPKSLLYLSMLMTKFPDEIQPVSPPAPVMKAMALIGRVLGYQV